MLPPPRRAAASTRVGLRRADDDIRENRRIAEEQQHVGDDSETDTAQADGTMRRRSFLAGAVAAGVVGGAAALAAALRSDSTEAPREPEPTTPEPTTPEPTTSESTPTTSREPDPKEPAGAVVCPVRPEDRDTTDEIAAWIAGLPAGAVITFAASRGRVYRIDRSLKVTGKHRLTIVDAAFRVAAPSTELDRAGRSTRRHLWFTSCTDLVLDRVSVRGQNTTDDDGIPVDENGQAAYDPRREWEHALAVEDCQRVTVTRFTADAVFGDGAYWRRITGGSLDHFKVSRNGRQGVAMIATSGLKLLNGTITNSRRSGIDLEPNSAREVIDDVEIGGMKIRSRLIPLTSGGPGTVRNVHVHDVIASSASVPSLSLVPKSGGRRDSWTVERWTSTAVLGSPLAVIRARDVTGLVIRDFHATCSARRRMTGVELVRAGTVRLERCVFEGATRLVTVIDPAADSSVTTVGCIPEA